MDTNAMDMTLNTIPSRLNRLVGDIPTIDDKDYEELFLNVPTSINQFDLRLSMYKTQKSTGQMLKYYYAKTKSFVDLLKIGLKNRK